MVFSSVTFLFLFLPLTLVTYFLTPVRYKNWLLLCASLVFYAWGEVAFVFIMMASIVFNWAFGLWMDAAQRKKGGVSTRAVLICSLVFNLGLLVFFKYFNFIMENANSVASLFGGSPVHWNAIPLPLGISFFTFHSMSYIFDVYREKSKVQRNLANIALYIALFPQLIAGPIIRYHDIARQLVQRRVNRAGFVAGIRRFILGLSKKVLIANSMGAIADKIFSVPASDMAFSIAWLGVISYSLQIYYDFSGYSDMAIGLGKMFGFEFRENFMFPYISRSVREFWTRWHISLSTWFRDYLYIPMGGNRYGEGKTYVNLLTVFVLCGLWHGASWTFLAWGIWHGLFLVLERTAFGRVLKGSWGWIQHSYTILVVVLGWILFRADNMNMVLSFLRNMIGAGQIASTAYPLGLYLNVETLLVLGIGILCSTKACIRMGMGKGYLPELGEVGTPSSSGIFGQITAYAGSMALFGLCVLSLASGTHNPFIYFRF
jgi:alginate O-acetyltransferase complex protein AlgI